MFHVACHKLHNPMEYKKEDFIKLVEKLKKQSGPDLSTAEDLSLAVMNLISLEEHLFFTAAKTEKSEYFDVSGEIRKLRKEAMEKLIGSHEGETWCATKHLLSSAMRLLEVGNKLQTEGKKEEAEKFFGMAYRVYSIFWALRLKLIEVKETQNEIKKTPFSMENLAAKLADCCSE